MEDEAVKPSPPKISILIFSRNQGAALRRCLAALEAAKERDRIEILVTDCGSTDGSSQIDLEFPKCTVLRMARNFGWTRAMNIGMRTATGEFVFFLDPSVELAPAAASILAALLSDREDAVAACPRLTDESGVVLPSIRKLPAPGTPWPQPQAPPASGEVVAVEFPAAALLVRKAFIQGMNYIDQRYGHSWADAEICFQARRGGKKILLVPQATGVWHAIPDPGGDLAEADRVAGAATFYGKHFGYVVALRFRLAAILRAFMGLRLGLVSNLLSGQKIDGTQGND